MSQASELLENLAAEPNIASNSPHADAVIVDIDRTIIVPDHIKKLGVQYDHNANVINFYCPRYFGDVDIAKMKIYVNYMRADGVLGMALCENITLDPMDLSLIHFEWVVSGHVTEVNGNISFLVCAKKVNKVTGEEETHWNSELCNDFYVSTGLKCKETVLKKHPDIITQLLLRMEAVEGDIVKWKDATKKELSDHVSSIETKAKGYMESAGASANTASVAERVVVEASDIAVKAAASAAEDAKYIYDTVNGAMATEDKLGLIMGGENTIDEDGTLVLTRTTTDKVLEDSVAGGLRVNRILGRSEQFKTSGAQLLNPEWYKNYTYVASVNITTNEDGSITLSGTASNTSAVNVNILSSGLKAGTYFLSCAGNVNSEVRIMAKKTGESAIYLHTERYATLDDINTYENAYFQIVLTAGKTYNETLYPMLNLGTTALPWEPYTGGKPAPNPENPQVIESVGDNDSVKVVVCGTNLCMEHVKGYISVSDKFIQMDNLSESFVFYANKGVTYSFGSDIAGDRSVIGYCDVVPITNMQKLYDIKNIYGQLSFTSEHDAYVCIYYNTVLNDEISNTFRVNVGETLLPYEPYTEQTIDISTPGGLLGIPVESGGNYVDHKGQHWIADEIMPGDDGKFKWKHNVAKVVFDGSSDEGWVKTATATSDIYRLKCNMLRGLAKPTSNNSEITCALCSHAVGSSPNGTYSQNNGFTFEADGGITLYDENFNTSNVALWTSHLASNPMTIIYGLVTPYETDLTMDEVASLFKLRANVPVTTISCDADMEVEYATSIVGAHALSAWNHSMLNALDVEVMEEREFISSDEFGSLALDEALALMCDKYFSETGTYCGRLKYSSGWVSFLVIAVDGLTWSGYLTRESYAATHSFYRNAGSKAVINRLTNNSISMVTTYADLLANAVSGYHVDALVVKEAINDVKADIDETSAKIGNCTFSVGADGAYVTYTPAGGADPVTKKLGEPTVDALQLSMGSYTATKDEKVLIDWGVYGNNNWDGGHNDAWINLNIMLNGESIVYESVKITGDRAFGSKEGNFIQELKAGDKITSATSNNVCNVKSSVRIISIPS